MKKIFVTNTGNETQAKVLLARKDLDITFVIEERFVDMYPPNSDLVIVENLNNPSNSVETVIKQRNCNDYVAVISLSERAALTAAYLRDYLGLVGPSFSSVLNCTNKFAMKRKFKEAGVETAEFNIAHSLEEVVLAGNNIGWPIIVKPVIGAGADATKVFSNEKDIYSDTGQAFFNRLYHPSTTSEKEFPVIVEQFLEVINEFHCDGYIENGEVKYVQVSQYLIPVLEYTSEIYGSFTLNSTSPIAQEIQEIHARIVKSVGIKDGVTHFEAFNTKNGIIAGEIACRPGGGGIRKMLQLQSGFDSWDAHLSVSLGKAYNEGDCSIEAQYAQLMLPIQRGLVESICSSEDFKSIPGVIDVDMKLTQGDVVGGLIDSSAVSGIIYAKIDDNHTLEHVLSSIKKSFFLKVTS